MTATLTPTRKESTMTNPTPRPAITDEQAALIGRRWESRTGTVRYYINDWAEILGFRIERYKTGNLRSVTRPDGEPLSNSKAGRLLGGKVWIEDGKLYAQVDWDDARIAPIPMQDPIRAEIARRQATLRAEQP
jgi:hypothetical protein